MITQNIMLIISQIDIDNNEYLFHEKDTFKKTDVLFSVYIIA